MAVHTRLAEVPLTRLDNADPELLGELLETVERVAGSARFTFGPELEAFEDEYADYCGATHAVGLSSGTDALILALRALDIGPGDEVLVPANSFIATAEAVSIIGATPRFVDVDPETALVSADTVEAEIGPHTRCLIAVHLYGRTAELDRVVSLARDRGLALIEDACQAHGARLGDRRAGTVADAGCFSFYPAKNLGAWGDAGALVTSDPHVADRVRLMRAHGERIRYHHEVIGMTARMDALQAAILRVKLRRLDGWNDARRRIGAALIEALHDAPVTPPAPLRPGTDHVFHQFVVRSDERERLRAHLAAYGIATAIHYPIPIHQTPAYADRARARRASGSGLGVAEDLARRVLSLPIYPAMTDEEIDAVAAGVEAFARC
ncbi:MAG: DegT/DnrJ/EryC1/StrS family aminotransferase [Solirubrobacterales bacterium]|nr:DegT/DnrJ/EryC1/StrS family aminotransferase [Solirubrobacterales bacterium]